MLAKHVDAFMDTDQLFRLEGRIAMKFMGCTDKSTLLDQIRTVGAEFEVADSDLKASHNLEAEMARKVEGWD